MNVSDWHRSAVGIDEALASLPSDYAVASYGDSRLVIGPSGAFVLVAAQTAEDRTSAATTLEQLAARTRSALADHLSWVPFIDTLVVAPAHQVKRTVNGVVPVNMLLETICEGRPQVDERALGVVRDLLRRGQLGSWRVGLVPSSDRIDLCDPAPQTTTRP
jgi:hypothetical protein